MYNKRWHRDRWHKHKGLQDTKSHHNPLHIALPDTPSSHTALCTQQASVPTTSQTNQRPIGGSWGRYCRFRL